MSFITGVEWTEDMFTPDADGRVHPTGAVAGGHEVLACRIDVENRRVWFDNSWGVQWGVDGSFYLTFADYGKLLKRQGEGTIFVSITAPALTPAPGGRGLGRLVV